MNKNTVLLTTFLLFIIAAFSGCNNDKLKVSNTDLNNEYYTKVNMWFYKKRTNETTTHNQLQGEENSIFSTFTVYSTNYKSENLLPLNTKVTLLKGSRNAIFFKINNEIYALKRTGHSKHVSLTDIFNRTFSKSPLDLNKIDPSIKELILNGEVKVGMSKEDILISRGYPPEHKTRKLENSTWYYWNSRHNKKRLEFEGEILNKIVE